MPDYGITIGVQVDDSDVTRFVEKMRALASSVNFGGAVQIPAGFGGAGQTAPLGTGKESVGFATQLQKESTVALQAARQSGTFSQAQYARAKAEVDVITNSLLAGARRFAQVMERFTAVPGRPGFVTSPAGRQVPVEDAKEVARRLAQKRQQEYFQANYGPALRTTPKIADDELEKAIRARINSEKKRAVSLEAQAVVQQRIVQNDIRHAQVSAEQTALTQRALAADDNYILSTAEASAARKRSATAIEALVQSELAASGDYIRNTAEAAAARRSIQRQVGAALVTPQREGGFAPTDRELRTEARTGIAEQVEKARLAQLRLIEITTGELQSIARGEAASAQLTARQNALKQEALASSAQYAQSLARSAIAQQQITLAKQREINTFNASAAGEKLAIDRTRAQEQAKAFKLKEQIAALELQLRGQIVGLVATNSVTELEVILKGLKKQQVAAQAAYAKRAGIPIGPTGADSVERDASGRTFKAGIAARFRSGAQYAVGGLTSLALYGGLTQALQAAQEFEREIGFLEQQMRNSDQAGQFPQTREAILRIARETGESSTDVAKVGLQLQGAFGGNTQRALDETEAAIKAVRVTGLSLTETVDAFTALTQNFDQFDVTIEQVADSALGLQEELGVLAKETISFAADLAPVAAQAGFTVEELEALGAVAQKFSGRSGASLAEAFGRIIPQVTERASDLLEILSQIPALAPRYDALADALSLGDVKTFILELAQGYNSLSEEQQNYVLETLGGRRETQALVGVLENNVELLEAIGVANNSAGKNSQYFAQQQKTLTQQFDEMREAFTQLVVQVLNSGLGDVLKDILGVVADLAGVLATFASGIGSLNDDLGGLIVRLGELYIAAVALKRLGLISAIPLPGIAGRTVGAGAVAQRIAPYNVTTLPGQTAPLAGAAPVAGAALAATGARGLAGRALAAFGGPVGIALLGATVVDTFAQHFIQGARKRANDRSTAKYKDYFDEPQTDQDRLALLADARRRSQFDFQADSGYFKSVTSFGPVGKIFQAAGGIANRYADRGGESDTLEARRAYLAGIGDDLKTRIKALKEAKLLPKVGGDELSEDEINDILAALNTGEASDEVFDLVVGLRQSIINAINDPKTKQKVLDALLKGGAKDDTKSALAQDAESRLYTSQQVSELYDLGGTTYQDAETSLRRAMEINSQLTQGGTAGSLDARKKYFEAVNRFNKFVSDAVDRQIEAQLDFLELNGQSDDPQARIDILLTSIPKVQDRDARQKRIQDLMQAYRDLLQKTADEAGSAAERLRILTQGIEIPESIRVEVIRSYLDDTNTSIQEWGKAAKLKGAALGELTVLMSQALAKGERDLAKAAKDAATAQLQKYQAALQLVGDPRAAGALAEGIKAMQAAIAAADAILGGQTSPIPGRITGTPEEKKQAGKDVAQRARDKAAAQREKIKAQLAVDRAASDNGAFSSAIAELKAAELDAQAARDEIQAAKSLDDADERAIALARAQANALNAQAAKINAQNALADAAREGAAAQREKIKAQLAVEKAASRNDPFVVANADLKIADLDVQAAQEQVAQANQIRNKDDRAVALARAQSALLQAQASRIEAQNRLADAVRDLMNSQFDLVIAQLDAAGRVVESAAKAREKAVNELNLFYSAGGKKGSIEANQLEAQVVSANANASRVARQDQQAEIDFLLATKRITKEQAIAQLTAILGTLEQGTQEYRDLAQQIYQMKQEADLQFNLPTEIALPTLYESRRQVQGEAAGIGYQDNRQITFQVAVSNTGDYQGFITGVLDAIDNKRQFGTYTGAYPR